MEFTKIIIILGTLFMILGAILELIEIRNGKSIQIRLRKGNISAYLSSTCFFISGFLITLAAILLM